LCFPKQVLAGALVTVFPNAPKALAYGKEGNVVHAGFKAKLQRLTVPFAWSMNQKIPAVKIVL
jgi:hypothetical protein